MLEPALFQDNEDDNNENEFDDDAVVENEFDDDAEVEDVLNVRNDENIHEERDFYLYTSIIRIIARLQSKGSVTNTVVNYCLDELEEIVFSLTSSLKTKVIDYFRTRNATQDPEVVELLSNFDFENPFDNLRTLKGQIKALKASCGYIEPIEIPFGYRIDNSLENGTYIPKLVLETCQYVPIIDTLKFGTIKYRS